MYLYPDIWYYFHLLVQNYSKYQKMIQKTKDFSPFCHANDCILQRT